MARLYRCDWCGKNDPSPGRVKVRGRLADRFWYYTWLWRTEDVCGDCMCKLNMLRVG